MSDLTGKTAVVTGGNGGLGLGLATGLAAAGADIAIWARNVEKSQAAVETLRKHGVRVEAVACDVGDEAAVVRATAETVEAFGKIDCLVANAGIASADRYVDTSLDEWHRVLRTNLDGTFLTTREVARHMIDRGEGGSMIVLSSTITKYGAAGQAAYAASKSGCAALGRTLAVEMARYRIRCNVLIPGWVATDMNTHLQADERFVDSTTRRTPVRRWATPDEFHSVASFLADPSLTFHTGNEVIVDGGYTIF
ncbi:NAD(P)-dependent dehydrogenase (short-subunit alcohol dehydrogenase family) [Williamsia limnetica]|uniref:NAD(P)-dependent dehydrogenase (Short-subunit alcohol dehydrogenase family) n=1 Tax=Williamsia limnetica TaxID=882452 RepID=A0A318RTG5_WILLI|nr:SDR family oxidoreductase [Williamsia limnetica]PYE12444.1 NAD(P)-dependent dehydrogenase (short-subunit alcohol dehydrogenase family) [Williamsia limnetica]